MHDPSPTGDAALDLWMPLAAGLQAWNGKCAESAAAINREWLDFVGRRLKEDFALPVHLAACSGPDDVWRTYAEFFQRMGSDYKGELAELTRLGTAFAAESMSALQSNVPEALQERRTSEAA